MMSPGGDLPSSPAQHRLNEADYPTISPTLQILWKSPQSTGTYGCQREVHHPLSPLAEPSAVLFYDSDDSEDDYDKTSAAARSLQQKKRTYSPQCSATIRFAVLLTIDCRGTEV